MFYSSVKAIPKKFETSNIEPERKPKLPTYMEQDPFVKDEYIETIEKSAEVLERLTKELQYEKMARKEALAALKTEQRKVKMLLKEIEEEEDDYL